MIYGLYQSAAGIQTASYRQDTIANNIANAETPGFKRDVALFKERLTEAQERRGSLGSSWSNPELEHLTGGTLATPTAIDARQGDLEPTGNPLDLAIEGNGYFMVQDGSGKQFLTRNGQLTTDSRGFLSLANANEYRLLGANGKPVSVPTGAPLVVARDGTISLGPKPIAQVGLFDANPESLKKQGETLLTFDPKGVRPSTTSVVRGEAIERSNVDPTIELADLMDAQRQLEANANMIRYQDQTLGRLVNEVGKIG